MFYIYNESLDLGFREMDLYPYLIILEPANRESLLVPGQKRAILLKEVEDWLDENIGQGKWMHMDCIISLDSEENAMAFLLRWQ